MLTLTFNEKDPHILRVTASYLLALAAPLDDLNQVASIHNELVDGTFNATELAESEANYQASANSNEASDVTDLKAQSTYQPTAAEVFGSKLPDGVRYTAVADQSPTAPVDTPATTLAPPPTIAPLPLAVADGSEASHAVPPTGSPASNVALDARGLPWDSRIHSREKTHIANGNWKNKRGVPEKILADVEAELRNLMAIPPAATVATPPPLAPAPIVTPPPSTIVAPPPAAITAPTANPSSEPFPALMTKVASAIAARKLNQAQVIALVNQAGIPSLPGLIQRPDLIPNIEAAIDAQIMMNEASGVAQ